VNKFYNFFALGGASDSHRIQLLEQERNEMENEMKRMQDNMRVVKQEERRIHEEEVNGLKTEKQELQKKFNTTEKKCKDLQIEVLNLKRKMEDEQRAHNKDMTEMIKKQIGKMISFIFYTHSCSVQSYRQIS
jgi:chromosome segregation ATPase